jgi:hypothetical protein
VCPEAAKIRNAKCSLCNEPGSRVVRLNAGPRIVSDILQFCVSFERHSFQTSKTSKPLTYLKRKHAQPQPMLLLSIERVIIANAVSL